MRWDHLWRWPKFGDSGSPWNMKGIRGFHVIGLCDKKSALNLLEEMVREFTVGMML